MTLALLIAFVAINIGYLVFADRKDARSADILRETRGEHACAVTVLLDRMKELDTAHRHEVQTLLQRIQAPEYAVIEHQQAQAGPDETQPLTDEEVAELQDRELALERIERMQREGMLT